MFARLVKSGDGKVVFVRVDSVLWVADALHKTPEPVTQIVMGEHSVSDGGADLFVFGDAEKVTDELERTAREFEQSIIHQIHD